MVEKPGAAPQKNTFSERLKDLGGRLKPAADELRKAGKHVKEGAKKAWDKTEPDRAELKKKGGEMLEKGKKKGGEIVEDGRKRLDDLKKKMFEKKETPKKKE